MFSITTLPWRMASFWTTLISLSLPHFDRTPFVQWQEAWCLPGELEAEHSGWLSFLVHVNRPTSCFLERWHTCPFSHFTSSLMTPEAKQGGEHFPSAPMHLRLPSPSKGHLFPLECATCSDLSALLAQPESPQILFLPSESPTVLVQFS